MKQVILKTAESKYRSVDLKDVYYWNGANVVAGPAADIFGQIPVGHNTLFNINIFNNVSPDATKHPVPGQGATDGARNGDEIYAKGIRLRMQLENDAGKHNNTWKFWLVEYSTSSGSPCNPTEFFHAITGNNLMDSIQTDRWTARLVGVYRTKARDVAADAKTNVFVNKWIPMKRKFCFKEDNSLVISKGIKQVYTLVGCCYDASNTAFNVACGNYRVNATLYFGDP